MAATMQITFDAADPGALAAFWAAALGYRLADPPSGFDSWDQALEAWGIPEERRNDRSALVDPDGDGPRLFFQKVPEPKAAKNRLHIDIRSAVGLEGAERMEALEARCAELVALGASRAERFEPGGINAGWIVMRDPEGNEFCLD
ncbi:VOC family protein [Georgenia alba]|uniref:VOC family protein n=1 Tax=Georgenia alba TaxID=2233858 RepID=A0ABW2Q7R9_9MICO